MRNIFVFLLVAGLLSLVSTIDAAGQERKTCPADPVRMIEHLACAADAQAEPSRWRALVDTLKRDAVVPPGHIFHSKRANRIPPLPRPQGIAATPVERWNPRDHLATPDREIFAARIGWHLNDTNAALAKGIDAGKPTVIVFGGQECVWCKRLIKDVMPCSAINRFAGRAVFAYSDLSADPAARALAEALGFKHFPAIAMLDPNALILDVPSRLRGFFTGRRYSKLMEKYLEKTRTWKRHAPTISQTDAILARHAPATTAPPPRACDTMPIWMK
jgi:hypothetical protein